MSPLVEQLSGALEAGTIEAFADIAPEQFEQLRVEFGRGSFTDDQCELLYGLVLIVTGKDTEVATFNEGSSINKLVPAQLADGEWVLPVSLLTDAGPGQTYAAAFSLLFALPVRRVAGPDWPRGEAL